MKPELCTLKIIDPSGSMFFNVTTLIHNRKELKVRRKDLRNHCTLEEQMLWFYLRRNGVGQKIRRQHSVGNFIVDFYCASKRVAIELDGSHHDHDKVKRYDKKRTEYLNGLNIQVIRFTNDRIHSDIEGVLKEIRDFLDSTEK